MTPIQFVLLTLLYAKATLCLFVAPVFNKWDRDPQGADVRMLRVVTFQNVLSVKFSSVVTIIIATKYSCWQTTDLTGTLCPYCGMTSKDVMNSTALVSTLAYVKQKMRCKFLEKAAGHFLSKHVCASQMIRYSTVTRVLTCSNADQLWQTKLKPEKTGNVLII